MLREPGSRRILAAGNTIPLAWDGPLESLPEEGWDWAMLSSVEDFEAGRQVRTLCAVSATVRPARQGQGLSRAVLEGMRRLARSLDLPRLVAPVRPSWKTRYPRLSIDSYRQRVGSDGLPLDPWLRTHARVGGRQVRACPRSMTLWGRVEDWERWTAQDFPSSGEYVVPELLSPLRIDREADEGLYIEPNVWVVHEL